VVSVVGASLIVYDRIVSKPAVLVGHRILGITLATLALSAALVAIASAAVFVGVALRRRNAVPWIHTLCSTSNSKPLGTCNSGA
jgi:hypothetical protein